MNWMQWCELTGDAILFPALGVTGWNLWRLRRLVRDAKAERDQAMALRMLLQKICLDAMCRASQPVWRAWAETMGTITVKVESGLRSFEREKD